MKLPPTLTYKFCPIISSDGRKKYAAGGFLGEFCTASSRKGDGDLRSASIGELVMVKPPTFSTVGMWTSSHWPGRNYCWTEERLLGWCVCISWVLRDRMAEDKEWRTFMPSARSMSRWRRCMEPPAAGVILLRVTA